MIQKEFYETRFDGVDLYRTYSDVNLKIRQGGTNRIFDEAIDVENISFTYAETNIPIEHNEEYTTEQKAEAYDIIVGN